MTKLIINVETGEEFGREFNKAEKDQQKKDEAIQAEQEILKNQKQEARNALLEKLGITAEEASLLLG
jgi:hypothetical protein